MINEQGRPNPDMNPELDLRKKSEQIGAAIEAIGDKNPELAKKMLKTFERLTEKVYSYTISSFGESNNDVRCIRLGSNQIKKIGDSLDKINLDEIFNLGEI